MKKVALFLALFTIFIYPVFAECDIKGNISRSGEKIYHVVGCKSYEATRISESKGERWFCTEEEALQAGWRKALNCPGEAYYDYSPPKNQIQNEYVKSVQAQVTRIVDGDTIDVSIDGRIERVRISGIDTPEVVHPSEPVQCFSEEASRKMKELVGGKRVILEPNVDGDNRGAYGRLIRYLRLGDGTDVGAEMIRQGYAFSYKKYPHSRLEEYNKLEQKARDTQRGLWALGACDYEEQMVQKVVSSSLEIPVTTDTNIKTKSDVSSDNVSLDNTDNYLAEKPEDNNFVVIILFLGVGYWIYRYCRKTNIG